MGFHNVKLFLPLESIFLTNKQVIPMKEQRLQQFLLLTSCILFFTIATNLTASTNPNPVGQKEEPIRLSVTQDTRICRGDSLELTVKASRAQGAVAFQWDQALGAGAVHKVSPTESTTYTVEAADEAGATATASVTVTVLEPPQPVITGDAYICPGVSAQLDAGEFSAYRWNTNATTRSIEVTDDGDFSVRVQDENGCWGEAAVQIKERPFKYPQIKGELGFCPGLTAKLDAGEFAAYQWSTGDKTRYIEVWDDGFYSVTVQDEFGCVSHAREEVLEYEPATPKIRGDLFFCPGSTTELNARGHFDFYAWSTGETTPKIEVGKAGVYRINVESEDGCLGENSVTIVELEAPKPQIEGPNRICPNETAILDAGSYRAYQWSTGDTLQTIEIGEAGVYQVTVTDNNGCTGATTLTVDRINPKLTAIDAGPDQEIRRGESVKLSAGRADRYQWEPAASLSCSDCRRPTATPLETTTYRLTAWGENGCPVEDRVTVRVLEE